MTWQEELRKLDEDFSSGNITADEYRVRRDHVLSSAVAPGQSAPGAEPGQQPAGPGRSDGPSNAESTQIISQSQLPQHPGTDAGTQFAPEPGGDPDQTQAVPPHWQAHQYGVSSPAGGFPQQPAMHSPAGGFPQPQEAGPSEPGGLYGGPQSQWNTTEADQSPLWGGTEFPPLAPTSSPDWLQQGPETADDESGRKSKAGLWSAVALLVVVAAGVAIWLLFIRDGGESSSPPPVAQDTTTQQPTTTTTTPSPTGDPDNPNQTLLDKLPEPPGLQDPDSGLVKPSKLVGLGAMGKNEVSALQKAKVDEVALRRSVKQPDANGAQPDEITLMVIPAGTESKAKSLASRLQRLNTKNKFDTISEPLPDMPEDLVFQKKTKGGDMIYRGTWVSGTNVLWVNVSPDAGDNEAELSGNYQRAVRSVLESYPTTG